MMRPVLFAGAVLASSCAFAQAQADLSGAELFEGACAACHGANGRGGQMAPSLLPRVAGEQDAGLIAFLRTGNPERGMPPAAVAEAQLPRLLEHLRFLVATADDVETALRAEEAQPRNRMVENFRPVDAKSLRDPDPADWLWFSRTPDAQRFSPLDQIDTANVRTLGLAWSRGLPSGMSEAIPLVHDGVMYLATPASSVMALDATTGDPIWEYRRAYADDATARQGRANTLSMLDDLLYFAAPDATLVALEARTGTVRWETGLGEYGTVAIDFAGKVILGGDCATAPRDDCFIAAYDAHTGALLWRLDTGHGSADFSGASAKRVDGMAPANGTMLATAGKLIFWRDGARHYRAVEADSGEVLWQTTLGGSVPMGDLTYAVNGRQYVAAIAGVPLAPQTSIAGDTPAVPLGAGAVDAAIYVFALPEAPQP
ncbi:MAG TPA: PQQ-binding-like beta-propeller repeat protein [Hyphomicrobiales bacterium]|nr:PQQ-binding-like beta-propeller repeat protein [Hyphomicrobiales bacterium]